MEKLRMLLHKARTHTYAPLVFLAVAMSILVLGVVLLMLSINARSTEAQSMMPVDQCAVVKEQTK